MKTNKRKTRNTAASSSTLIVDLCNIRGLHSNLNEVHQHLETSKPALLFLTETQISLPDDTRYMHYPGYNLEHHFVRRAGVCLFVREDICARRLHNLEDKDLSILWVHVDYGGSTRIYACLYNSHGGDRYSTLFIEHVQEATDRVIEQYPSAEIMVLGDFNAHHKVWLGSLTTCKW